MKVREILNTDRRLSLKFIADESQLGQTTVNMLITEDLQMRKVCAKFVPTRRSSSPNFWLSSTWQNCHKPLTVLTLLPVTFLFIRLKKT